MKALGKPAMTIPTRHGVPAEDVIVKHLPFAAALGTRGHHILLADFIEERIFLSSVMVAKAPSAIEISGNVMCQK